MKNEGDIITENVQFVPVDLFIHRSQIIDLNVEYMSWANEEIADYFKIDVRAIMGVPVREYVTNTIASMQSYTPPKGIYYLLIIKETIIGMGALRQIRENIGEIKRMYIRPVYRGKGYGQALLDRLLQKAKEYGYRSVYLDSPPFSTIAHHLYHSNGFVDREEYPETEVPQQLRSQWLFMEKTLEDATL